MHSSNVCVVLHGFVRLFEKLVKNHPKVVKNFQSVVVLTGFVKHLYGFA